MKIKKLLALVLSGAMAVSMLSVAAAAEGEVPAAEPPVEQAEAPASALNVETIWQYLDAQGVDTSKISGITVSDQATGWAESLAAKVVEDPSILERDEKGMTLNFDKAASDVGLSVSSLVRSEQSLTMDRVKDIRENVSYSFSFRDARYEADTIDEVAGANIALLRIIFDDMISSAAFEVGAKDLQIDGVGHWIVVVHMVAVDKNA